MKGNEQLQPQQQQQVVVLPKKQSHQIKALFYKTSSLQWKQPCTNICQIVTPIICLVFTVMIRNVAIQNLPTNQTNAYNQVPFIPFKFNDFWLMNELKNEAFQFDCNRWLLYDWKRDQDVAFIGTRDGVNTSTGMFRHVPKTNNQPCWVNQSYYYPYSLQQKNTIPYFRNPHNTINQDIYDRYLYFNNMTLNNIWGTSAIQKMPDGAIFFNQATKQRLDFDLKVNDERSFQLHNKNGITRISIRNPLQQNATWQQYFTISQGLLNLLDMVTFSYIKQLTSKQFVSGYIYMPMSSNTSIFIQTLINIVSTIIFPLSLSLLLPVFLYNLVLQKQTKIIQMMRMNGLSILTYWLVNFLFNVIISLLTYGVFYGFGYFYMRTPFFLNTSPLIMWVVLIGWMICQIGMSMIFQVFISNSRAANIIGYLITIWTNLIGATLSVALYQYPVEMPSLVTLWPTIAFNRIFYLMFINCSADHCYNDFATLPDEVMRCILIIYGMAVLFMLLGMYLFEVIPQEFGISKNIFFPFNFLKRKRKIERDVQDFGYLQTQLQFQCDQLAINQIKKVDSNRFQDHALICDRLTKIYDNGKKATVDFSLLLQDNQVFGLLGPNGAGKTTLISMITGIFSPSSGTAYVAGYNIQTQIDSVHMNMGVCPQFDILWQQLTVQEHLYFYARLRGTPGAKQDQKVKQTLKQVALQEFKKFKVKELSGGMKRRLSVAISMVGDPRIVFLDQPTTGLDPENRRNLWELLSKCKDRRSLFLTTHLMEEAQSLCDKIGIITNGRLRTVGDQMNLKKRYGNGYSLTLSVQMQKQVYHPIQSYYDDSQSRSEYSSSSYASRQSHASILSSSNQINPNYLMNDSIDPVSYYVNQQKNNRKRSKPTKYQKVQTGHQYYQQNHHKQQLQKFDSQSQASYFSKPVSHLEFKVLKYLILKTFSSRPDSFIMSQISGRQSTITYPRITKELNGTLQFNLGSKIKISKVLEQLNKIKENGVKKMIQQIKENQRKHKMYHQQKYDQDPHSSYYQSNTHGIINKQQQQNLFNQIEDFQSDIKFQWAINNSSLEDVFLNVVANYPKSQNYRLQDQQQDE